MKVKFVRKELEAKNIVSLYLEPDKPFNYIAGQFIELTIPHIDNEKRWFTLSSSPTEPLLMITTKIDDGKPFKSALDNLVAGTELDVSSPMGDFVLPKDPSIPLVFIAAGIGCTPFRSMITYLRDTNETRDITIIYAAKSAEEIAFKQLFGTLGTKFKTLVAGCLTAEKVMELADVTEKHHIYLSGPESMVEMIERDLKRLHIHHFHVRTDFFPGYSSL